MKRVAAAAAVSAALRSALTWRLDVRSAGGPQCGEPAVYVGWHEHVVLLAWLFRRTRAARARGGITLVSKSKDGAIAARVLRGLGFRVVQGSSAQGGSAGFRELVRCAEDSGRPVVLSVDGSRGPRREPKMGAARLARLSGRVVRPVGLAVESGWRLSSWDRVLIPAPGSRVCAVLGPPSAPDCALGLREAMEQAELTAGAELRDRLGGASFRHPVETWVRRSWTVPRPPALLGAASAGYRLGARLHRAAARVRRSRRSRLPVGSLADLPPVTVIGVGGLTVGGCGKTPIAAWAAQQLSRAGSKTCLITRGYGDELAQHRAQLPHVTVCGGKDRAALIRKAAAEGARVVVLDDSYQNYRVRPDLTILAVDRDALGRTSGRVFPAGPFREEWPRDATRADWIVFTGREPRGARTMRLDAQLRERAARALPKARTASLWFEPGEPVPASTAARAATRPDPRLAVAGVMKPNLFFEAARAVFPGLEVCLPLSDHGLPPRRNHEGLRAAAGSGVAITAKDLQRLGPVFGDEVPVWVVPERLRWTRGEKALATALIDAAAAPGSRGSVPVPMHRPATPRPPAPAKVDAA